MFILTRTLISSLTTKILVKANKLLKKEKIQKVLTFPGQIYPKREASKKFSSSRKLSNNKFLANIRRKN
jgi:capsule polysaccharide export protein KpsC/LpsZ